MPCSFHPHLHPSFVLVFSSHQCENTQETFTTMWLFTHLLLIRDLNVHWRHIPQGIWPYSTTYKQTLSQISSWHALHSARPAVIRPRQACTVQLCNCETLTRKACHHGFDEWMDIRLLASFQALMYGVPGTGRLTWGSKAVSYFQAEVWVWLGGSGKAFGGLEHQSDRAVSHYAPL